MRRVLVTVLAVVAASLALPVNAVRAAPSGSWKVDCTYVKSAPDDPIVLPNQPGAAHLHDFFGNVGISAYSTYDTLKGVTSTCAHSDHSSYWVPSLYRNGTLVKPSSFIAYYENRATAGTVIEPFPPGFQMVFGNKNATSASQVDVHIQWGCSDNTLITAAVPVACSSGAIQMRLMWPSCWDGTTSATGNATGHVSFLPGGVCKGHALPTIRTNIVYPVGTTTGDITLSSGSVYSVHGDFFNAWDQATLTSLVAECLNGAKACGHFKGTSSGLPAPSVPAAAAVAAAPGRTAAPPTPVPTSAAPTPGYTEDAGDAADAADADALAANALGAVAVGNTATTEPSGGSASLAGVGGGLLLIVAGVSAWLLLRRRRRSSPLRR